MKRWRKYTDIFLGIGLKLFKIYILQTYLYKWRVLTPNIKFIKYKDFKYQYYFFVFEAWSDYKI